MFYMRSVRFCLPLAVAALLVLFAASAEAATFGPDLNSATANDTDTCPVYAGCTLQDPHVNDMGLVLPDPVVNGDQAGIVTAIHVKASEPAPAQFVAVEWSGKPAEGNPFPSGVMALSEQVTLQAGINNFNTNLPVDRRLAANGFESWTVVSLNILNGTSRIPAQLGGSFSTTGFLLDNWLPLTQTTSDLTAPPHNVSVGGLTPATLLMSGDVTITTPLAPNPVPNPVPTPAPDLTIPATGRVKGNTVRLPLECVGAADCAGKLLVQNLAAANATAAKKSKQPKRVTYASSSFSIAAGKSQSVKMQLSKAGKKAIRRHRSLKAYANATFTGGSVKSSKINLKR